MNWDDVRVFLAVARSSQMLAAARQLGLNHATVSRRISALEASLNTTLLVRRTSGCDLTAEGEAFLKFAERMETETLAAQSHLGQTDSSASGTVRIGAPDGFGVSFLAPRLAQIARKHPGLQLQLVPVPRAFSLSSREADIAITVDRPAEGRLVSRRLVDYSLGLYATPAYLEEYGSVETSGQLIDHRLIGYVDDLLFSPSLDYNREFTRQWRTSFAISSAIGQTEAVRGNAGIGVLHDYIARQYRDLVPVLPALKVKRSYWIVVHETAQNLARIRAVLDFIVRATQSERSIFMAPSDGK